MKHSNKPVLKSSVAHGGSVSPAQSSGRPIAKFVRRHPDLSDGARDFALARRYGGKVAAP